MGKTKIIQLTAEQRAALEDGYRNGKSHAFRQRCQMILLKSEKRSSLEVSNILGTCEVAINGWLKRFEAQGIQGLQTRPGRGRKSLLQAPDLLTVKAAVQQSRQRIAFAKAELEERLHKPFSLTTLKRFVKKTVDASNALEGD